MTNGPHGSVDHCRSARPHYCKFVTYLSALDELNPFLNPSHRHQNQHDNDISHRIVQGPRHIPHFDALRPSQRDIDMLYNISTLDPKEVRQD